MRLVTMKFFRRLLTCWTCRRGASPQLREPLSPWSDFFSVDVEFLQGQVVWEKEMEAALVKHLNDAASKRPKHKHAHTGKLTITKGTLYVMVGLELVVTYPIKGISDMYMSSKDPKVFGYVAMNNKSGTPFLFTYRLKEKGVKGDYVDAALACARFAERLGTSLPRERASQHPPHPLQHSGELPVLTSSEQLDHGEYTNTNSTTQTSHTGMFNGTILHPPTEDCEVSCVLNDGGEPMPGLSQPPPTLSEAVPQNIPKPPPPPPLPPVPTAHKTKKTEDCEVPCVFKDGGEPMPGLSQPPPTLSEAVPQNIPKPPPPPPLPPVPTAHKTKKTEDCEVPCVFKDGGEPMPGLSQPPLTLSEAMQQNIPKPPPPPPLPPVPTAHKPKSKSELAQHIPEHDSVVRVTVEELRKARDSLQSRSHGVVTEPSGMTETSVSEDLSAVLQHGITAIRTQVAPSSSEDSDSEDAEWETQDAEDTHVLATPSSKQSTHSLEVVAQITLEPPPTPPVPPTPTGKEVNSMVSPCLPEQCSVRCPTADELRRGRESLQNRGHSDIIVAPSKPGGMEGVMQCAYVNMEPRIEVGHTEDTSDSDWDP